MYMPSRVPNSEVKQVVNDIADYYNSIEELKYIKYYVDNMLHTAEERKVLENKLSNAH